MLPVENVQETGSSANVSSDGSPGTRSVDSTRKLSQVSASILSHWFKGNFGYSNVDKSTSVSASWTPFLGFCRTDLVVRA